jgi:two-component system, OmpR family, phosphate regulon sensor histidine kinase PhoR
VLKVLATASHEGLFIYLYSMRNKHLRTIIICGAVVLGSLLVVQIYWFKRAFDVAERQMDHTIQVALKKVADSVSRESEVKKLSSNFFFVTTNSLLNDKAVDSLLKKEFDLRKIQIDYELGVYRALDDTLVYGNYVPATYELPGGVSDRSASSEDIKNFAVYFPRKKSYLTAHMDIWIFSTLALLIMMGFFSYAIITLLRERRFAELKNDFINNMTHEFKTPVTNIQIAGEILRNKITDPALLPYLDILVKENNKLKGKIDQVLLGSSADYLKRTSFQAVDIHQILAECSEAFEFKIRERQGSLELQFDASASTVIGDRELLANAINNIIDNAEKYSKGKPHIIVRTKDHHQNRIRIEIVDNGIGIDPAMARNVFQRFFRVPSGDLHNVKGFGLGLNFVQQVVQSHQGEVTLASELNGGTEVRIFLPRA